jgi:hypothetical protein
MIQGRIQLFLFLIAFCNSIIAQVSFNPNILEEHVIFLASDSLEGRGFGSNQEARDYIVDEFKKAGLQPINSSYIDSFTARVSIVRVEGKNVVGIIPGNDPELKDEYIVIGAHYDHLGYEIEDDKKVVYNGADDNASGTAAIIEIAKELVKNQSQLKRSVIIVAFDGEETGLHGSTQFLKNNVVDIKDIKLMFSLDMVGMYSENNGVDLHGVGSLENFDLILEKVKQDVKITNKSKSIENRTDTQPFGKEGIPAIHVYTGSKSPYHKPEDDSDLLDYEGMAVVCGLVYRFTQEAAMQPELIPIESLTTEAEKKDIPIFLTGMRINTGNYRHHYKDEFYEAKSLFALDAGLFTQIRLTKRFRLQPEVIYELKRSEHMDGNLSMHAVSVPVNLLITTGDPEGFNPMAYFLAGGYYSYNFAGKIGKEDIDFDNFETEEYGLNIGICIQVQKIQMGYYQKIGLSDVAKNNTAGEILGRSSYFTFGLLF